MYMRIAKSADGNGGDPCWAELFRNNPRELIKISAELVAERRVPKNSRSASPPRERETEAKGEERANVPLELGSSVEQSL